MICIFLAFSFCSNFCENNVVLVAGLTGDVYVFFRQRKVMWSAAGVAAVGATFGYMLWCRDATRDATNVVYADSPSPAFVLPPLPFDKAELAPFISKETVEFHYEKHHRGYVTKLNELTQGSNLAGKSLEQLIVQEKSGKVFNLAAQIWNHTFYWNCLRAAHRPPSAPSADLAAAIDAQFGSFDAFKKQFTEAAVGHFGSGWTWLVRDRASGQLQIVATHDAGCPLTSQQVPLLTCDVWEHAYYIDYRNDRAKYVNNWWQLVNWDFVSAQYRARL
jgi:Fe-Mn family superoxide dismutase